MSCTFSSCKFRATLHSSSRLPLHSHPLHSHHMAQHAHKLKKSIALHSHHMAQYAHKVDCGPCCSAKTASIMQTPSKKRTTKDVEDDAMQQGHKRSKHSNNGGTTAMQTKSWLMQRHPIIIFFPSANHVRQIITNQKLHPHSRDRSRNVCK